MQIDAFRLLSYDEQVDVLYREGIYIGKKRIGDETVLLYQLDAFYVKLFYSKYRETVRNIFIFTSTRFITDYLHHINIEALNLSLQDK